SFLGGFATCLVNQDAAHGLGGGGEEVAAAVPVLGLFDIHQAQIGLVDQGRGLEGLSRLFLSQQLGREPAQFVVDQGDEWLGGGRVALLDGRQDARDLTHWRNHAGRGGTVWWSILDGVACRQHALDNNGSDKVEALVRRAGAEADRAQDAGWDGSLD